MWTLESESIKVGDFEIEEIVLMPLASEPLKN